MARARAGRAKGEGLSDVVRAAGGIVVRDRGRGPEVLVVHRPRYDDWSFPKGKARAGEADDACALREVEEETGLVCVLGRELLSTAYTDAHGRPKRVRYWLMRPVAGELAFRHEVDAADWLDPEAAAGRLTYPRDVELLGALTAGRTEPRAEQRPGRYERCP